MMLLLKTWKHWKKNFLFLCNNIFFAYMQLMQLITGLIIKFACYENIADTSCNCVIFFFLLDEAKSKAVQSGVSKSMGQ